jgi:transposase
MAVHMEKRKRRKFTTEFKAETVRLVQAGGRSIGEVARDLDLTESALRLWVRQAEIDAGRGKPPPAPIIGETASRTSLV